MSHNQTIKLYLHGLNGEYKFWIWDSTTHMPVPTLRADMRYRLEVYRDDTLTYACSPQSAEFVMGQLAELLLSEPGHLSNSPWQVQGIKLPGLPAVEFGADLQAKLDALTQKRMHIRFAFPLGKTEVVTEKVQAQPSPTATLTQEEDRAEDDLVFQNCEDWSDRLKAKHYRQLHSLGMTLERAESIIRKTNAKG